MLTRDGHCQINNSLPPGIELVSADNFEEWTLDIRVLDNNPLYQGQTYRLKFKFASTYPIGMYASRLPRPCRRGGFRPGAMHSRSSGFTATD